MKRLFVLTAIVALTVGTTGCRNCRWLWRGAPEPEPVMINSCDPCNPCVTSCDPCGTCAAPGACAAPGLVPQPGDAMQ